MYDRAARKYWNIVNVEERELMILQNDLGKDVPTQSFHEFAIAKAVTILERYCIYRDN